MWFVLLRGFMLRNMVPVRAAFTQIFIYPAYAYTRHGV